MKSKLLVIAMLAAALSSAPALAQWHGQEHKADATPEKKKGPHSSQWDLTLSLLYPSTSTNDGPCTGGAGNADHCLSGDCLCFTATGTAKGSAGNGPVNFYETVDAGGRVGPMDDDSGCEPVYGDIEIAGKVDTESIAFVGSLCFSSIAPEILEGGCQLTDSEKFPGVGLGQCGGNVNTIIDQPFTIKGRAE
jgi:hypothetical protein